MTVTRKKLIEVALPLEAINIASAREKSIRHGHPSTLHLWWARRPLAAARAVIFAQMVDDPSTYVDTLLGIPATRRAAERELKKRRELWETRQAAFAAATRREDVSVPGPGPEPTLDDCAADIERQRLFRIIEELVLWENTTNETVLDKARAEIWQSWRRACADNAGHPRAAELFDRNRLPAFHDPFAGGGTLPLEAQRLGLEAHASDLNPVAVLINKAMIEIPPKFVGLPPMNPTRDLHKHWTGAQGLAEDVRYYGRWMRDEAEKRIGHFYPKIEITPQMAAERPDLKPLVGRKLTVVAWLWARTVKSPNPAFSEVDVPLASTFMLSTKVGKEAYVEPVVESSQYHFAVKIGAPKRRDSVISGTKSGGSNFRCLLSGSAIDAAYIRSEAQAGRMGSRLLAVICESEKGRAFISPNDDIESFARSVPEVWKPDLLVPTQCHDVDRLPMYGMPTWGAAFSRRQQLALTTFSDLVVQARLQLTSDAIAVSPSDDRTLEAGGSGRNAYADAVAVFLALGVGRSANYWSSLTPWAGDFIVQTFGRNAIRMVWDYAEANPFSASTANWLGAIDWICRVIGTSLVAHGEGHATQLDAQSQEISKDRIVSTDPPYYDNIGYAELSDFFYVWLRRALRGILPVLFGTLAVPKFEELVAAAHRHGNKKSAEAFFLNGMKRVMHQISLLGHPGFPVTIYYAFKQSEAKNESGMVNTGWETFLEAVIQSGLSITGTWPIRTERDQGLKTGTNVLASSIVLVCRKIEFKESSCIRRDFLNYLRDELPEALRQLQRGNIAPADLAQASIGPGVAIFTRYERVVDAQGKTLSVREALAIINEVLDEVLVEQEGDFDADSRFAVAWFEQFGFAEGAFGVADVLARAKVTSVAGLAEAGILASKGGKVRLLRPEELETDWDPASDGRLTVWEMVHQLIRALDAGEATAAALTAKLGARAEVARELAYRLYTICERKKRAAEALTYNSLVQSWPEIMRLARDTTTIAGPAEPRLDL